MCRHAATKRTAMTALLLAGGIHLSAQAQNAEVACEPLQLNHRQPNPSASADDLYGYAVATNGKYTVVGSKQEDQGAHNAGVLYKYNTHTGELQLTIRNPFPGYADHFGDRLEYLGHNILSGVHYNDRHALNTGAVYLFGGTTGRLLQDYYSPTPDEGDLFGFAIAPVGDRRVLIGAHRDDTKSEDSGAAYFYDAYSGDHLQSFFHPSGESHARFGISMTWLGGGRVAIGSHYDDSVADNGGAVYIFDVNTGNLLSTLTSPNPTDQGKFGWDVTTVGGNLLVGAFNDDTGQGNTGAAYLYSASGNLIRTIESPLAQDDARFGFSLSPMGRDLLIGAPGVGDNQQGAAYLFDGATGELIKSFSSPNSASRWFGYDVSSSGAHNITIGAPRDSTQGSNAGYSFVYGDCGEIHGSVWLDDSNDGIRNHVEDGYGKVEINLSGTDVNGNPLSARAWTGNDGFYHFRNLPAGDY
ncbi:MAG: SdrD B-like domain-containing protein, partial [Phycisphaeraceae bacterium]|nr:SdrD B-like domain-containing protein [Phycisphaeraceae bacterium]